MASLQTKRKLAAILVADIAGYSQLMGADEEGTLARLKVLRSELIVDFCDRVGTVALGEARLRNRTHSQVGG